MTGSAILSGITDTALLYQVDGTDVAVTDGGTGASTAAAARSNLGAAADWFSPSIGINEYVVAPAISFSTMGSGTTGNLWLTRIYLPALYTFDRISARLATVAGTTGTARLGVYADASGRPSGTAILDAGTISLLTTTGTKEITISQQLGPGTYWTAMLIEFTGTAPTLTGVTNSVPYMPSGADAVVVAGLLLAGQTGTLPSSPSAAIRQTQVPVVWLRRSA